VVLKKLFASIVCATLLALNGPAVADEVGADSYPPGQFLGLDLSTAVLSPKRLGPPTQFQPFPVEASTETSPATAGRKTAAHIVIPKMKTEIKVAQVREARPHRAGAKKPALSHGNPLDAEAMDTRIQVWPCRSGGICNWQR